MKSLSEIQAEIQEWTKQFGTNISRDEDSMSYACSLDSLAPLLGMVEEIGELCHVTVYRHQGRGFTPAEARAAKIDALADLLIFSCDYASREGIDLTSALNETWEKVQHRRRDSWKKDKQAEQRGAIGNRIVEDMRRSGEVDTRTAENMERDLRFQWANKDISASHQWNKLEDGRVKANARCLKCGAYANLSSGFMECPVTVVATKEPPGGEDRTSVVIVGCAGVSGSLSPVCAHCRGEGMIRCAWSTESLPCPACQVQF
jgi:NTP pyrophosphatase (non-canonical NTP hydrolase)